MTNEEVVEYIVTGIDRGATKLNKDVLTGLKGIETQSGATAMGVNKITSSLTSLSSWVKAGFGAAIGADIFHAIDEGLSSLVRGFEGAIAGGQAWLLTIHDIETATGMTAEQSSEWASVMERMGVPLTDVSRILAQIGRSVVDNGKAWDAAGVQIRAANGESLDAYTILTNLREAVVKHGDALTTLALVQDLVGRSGYNILPMLRLTDAEYQTLAKDAAAAGDIVTEQQVHQAQMLEELQKRTDQVITGLQTSIFSGVAPVLLTFVNEFSNWIESNTQRIVSFVSNAANFIAGVIGGLLGFDFTSKLTGIVDDTTKQAAQVPETYAVWAKQAASAASGTDTLTASVNAQINAIDAQIAAISRRSDAEHAAMERARLDQSLATAQQQLADLKGNAPFTQGLSNAEAQLARQKHAQDIIDAQKAVSDATGAITMFEADQSVAAERKRLEAKKASLQDELAAHKKATDLRAQYEQYLATFSQAADDSMGQHASDLYAGITKDAQVWRDKGVSFANDLKTAVDTVQMAILGGDVTRYEGSTLVTRHSDGLIGALQQLADELSKFVAWVAGAADFLSTLPSLQNLGLAPTNRYDQSPLGQFFKGSAEGGMVGLNGPEIRVVGEKGPEYITPNDELDRLGRGSTPAAHSVTIHNHFDFLSMPSGQQLKQLVDLLDEQFGIRADNAPVGLQGFRAAG